MTVNAGEALALGVLSDWRGTYDNTYLADKKDFAPFLRFDVPGTSYLNRYAYPEIPSYPRRSEWGQRISGSPFRYIGYSTRQERWTDEVKLLEMHAELAQGGLNPRETAEQQAALFATLPVRAMTTSGLLGTVDPDLLPTALLAPDGVGPISALDGQGDARFGVSGGNLVTGVDVSTGAGFRSAVGQMIERLIQFKDPRGQPLHSQRLALRKGVTVMFPPGLLLQWLEAFQQTQTPYVGSSTAAGNVPVTNALIEGGYQISPLINPYLTDETRIYMTLNGAPIPLFFQVRTKPLRSLYFNPTNSEDRASTGTERWLHEEWWGLGCNLPLWTVAADDS